MFPDDSLTDAQKAIFQDAADRWAEMIIGDLPDVGDIDDLQIQATAPAIDGAGGVLGQAGPTEFRADSGLPYAGIMQFDSADVAALEASGGFIDVVLHEMAHVIGLGTIWENLGLVTGLNGTDPRFEGANAVREHNVIFGDNDASVPVANTGGGGTFGGHWRESVYDNELMTGFLNDGVANPVSRVTVGQFEDLGYVVNYDAADAFTDPAGLLASVASNMPANAPRGFSLILSPEQAAAAWIDDYDPIAAAMPTATSTLAAAPAALASVNAASSSVPRPGDKFWTVDVYADAIVSGADFGMQVIDTVPEFTSSSLVSVSEGGSSVINVSATDHDIVSKKAFIGQQNLGIAVDDTVTSGTGYFMHFTAAPERFSVAFPAYSSTDFIVVQYDGSNWQFNTNDAWVDFTPDASDRLVASFDFADDDAGATHLNTAASVASWTGKVGMSGGDLAFTVNQWNGTYNNGEYSVSGTYFSFPEDETLIYSISGGDDQSHFAIDANNGHLTFVSAPDFDNPTDVDTDNVYRVQVTATDSFGNMASQTLDITVTKSADRIIVFSSTATATHMENAGAGALALDIDAGNVEDASDTLTYSLSGGADKSLFQIDPNSGELSFTSSPNFESPADADKDNVYDVVVSAVGSVTNSQAVAISITDANEAPTISHSGAVSIQEGEQMILNVNARDEDLMNKSVSLDSQGSGIAVDDSITSGTGYFMHFTTGTGRFQVDFAAASSKDFVVVQWNGSDWQYNTNSNWVTFTPNASDRLLAKFDFGNDAAGVQSLGTFDSIAGWAGAVGTDGGDLNFKINSWNGAYNNGEYSVDGSYYTIEQAEVLTYSISGGADHALFTIDPNNGELSLITAADFENPTDANGNNVYDVVVTAKDTAGHSVDQSIAVTVTDVANEGTPVYIGNQRMGIAVDDSLDSGIGYFMHFTSNASRFAVDFSSVSSIDFVVVRHNGTNWEYNTNSNWNVFTPEASDRLVASVDFGDDASGVTTLSTSDSVSDWTNGVGVDGGDIKFGVNTWNGSYNDGEYTVTGTHYLIK